MKILLGSLAAIVIASVVAGVAYAQGADDLVAQRLHGRQLPNNFPLPNSAGFAATYSTRGFVDFTTPFHDALGTNGRSCGTCHVANSAWSMTPADTKFLFLLTGGRHPLFRAPDANNPAAPVETIAQRRAAYNMLLDKALFRRTLPVPAGAEFEVVAIDDPYGMATPTSLTMFRRPLMTTNLQFAHGVHWDIRTEPVGNLHHALAAQVRGSVVNAMQGTAPPPPAVTEEVVSWEESLSTAQVWVHGVGALDRCGARGGPEFLAQQPKVAGRFDLFDAWIDLAPRSCTDRKTDARRAQIARGQELFNAGCNGCHNVANNGTNLDGRLFNIGVSAASRRTPAMPLYTLRKLGEDATIQTTDPGRGMITGRWGDIDRFKVPSLRGLAARAPYFHNGIAASLHDVVHLYEESLGFDFTPDEEADLVAFLRAL
jgi:cytochrome c peroxidase